MKIIPQNNRDVKQFSYRNKIMQKTDLADVQLYIRLQIIKLRRELAFTQEELANELGFSQSFVNQIETGQKDCNIEHIYKFATIFQCSVYDILPNFHLGIGVKDE